MSVNAHPGKQPLAPPAPHHWGRLAPENQTAVVLRLVLVDRSVSYPVGELRRWEHVAGSLETLTILVGREMVTIEGEQLAAVRGALDENRLCELRSSSGKTTGRAGPQIRRIAVEQA